MNHGMTSVEAGALGHHEALIDRLRNDEVFNARFKDDPKAMIEEMGGQVPSDIEIKVVEDSATVMHLHLPVAPVEGEVSDDDLGVYGGWTIPAIGTTGWSLYVTGAGVVAVVVTVIVTET